mmetsp:Transcript_29908/g.95272  ORF Transcript_29908/g.95272 Transcript_29908/m.95272 type:complete len:141 (-) Transcript_29908:674-1096(-)
MAPRQLRLEPIEADMGADKGLKRVRVESTEESSTQMETARVDPFMPIAAELADDEPADGVNDTSSPGLQKNRKPPLARRKPEGPKSPPEDSTTVATFSARLHPKDYLKTIEQPFIRIDTKKANWEGEPSQAPTKCHYKVN